MTSIGIIGAGAWGTALAQILAASDDMSVKIWAREKDLVNQINNDQENKQYLPGVELSPLIIATNRLEEIAKSKILLLVTPAQNLREVLGSMQGALPQSTHLVCCSKGIELESGMLMSDVMQDVCPDNPRAILTGPTFANEIAKGLPSAVTIGASSEDHARELQAAIGVKHFRPYISTDIVGVQLGGAIKNVLAIACGIVMGRQMGESARAALLTRGVAEIARLGIAMGAGKTTLMGMCGFGDLMLTCSSKQSRNYSLGLALGEGQTIESILGNRRSVTEGVYTAKAALDLAKKNAVDMPITEAVNNVLNKGMHIEAAIEEMLNRPFKYEIKTGKRRGH